MSESGTTTKTPHTTPFEFGDVVLVSFPFSNQSATKRRPAVIVSSNAYNAARRDLIIMAVTSQAEKSAQPGDFPIADLAAAGLLKASYGKPALATIEQQLVRKRIGHFSEPDLASLRASLKQIIGAWTENPAVGTELPGA